MKTRFLKPAMAAAAAALALSACASVTPYGPAGVDSRYGYSDIRIDGDRYRVSYAGNSLTSREQVEMGLLLRAAEITLETGNDWFATVDRATDRDTRLVGTPDPFYNRYGYGWGPTWRYYRGGYWSPWSRWGGWNDSFWGGRDIDYRQIDRYEATAEILVNDGRKPANDANAFDAREVVQNLGPRVPRPMAGSR